MRVCVCVRKTCRFAQFACRVSTVDDRAEACGQAVAAAKAAGICSDGPVVALYIGADGPQVQVM